MDDRTGTMPLGEMTMFDDSRVSPDVGKAQTVGQHILPMPGEAEPAMPPGDVRPMPGANETEGACMEMTVLTTAAKKGAMPKGEMTRCDRQETIELPGTWRLTLTRLSS